MRKSLGDVPDADAGQTVHQKVDDKGQDLMDSWSKSHEEKPKRKTLVDMYPPTAAPQVDMLKLALDRGFGKKADLALKAPVSKADELHKAMHSITDTSSLIMAQWAKNHPAGAA